jgi:DNA-binding transcriptional regulator YdaS (Cro superfamily)
MKTTSVERFLSSLRRDVKRAGGQSEWARQTGVDRSYVSKVLCGRKPPGPSICHALGLEGLIWHEREDRTKFAIDVREAVLILRSQIDAAGSISAWSRRTGIDRSYISQVLNGRKGIGKRIPKALGLSSALTDRVANVGKNTLHRQTKHRL